MLGSSQTVCWPQKQSHQNSAASAVCGLKMVEAGKQCSQDAVFFFHLLLAGAQGHTNMSKMSINAEFRLSAWLLSAEMESTAQLLTQRRKPVVYILQTLDVRYPSRWDFSEERSRRASLHSRFQAFAALNR